MTTQHESVAIHLEIARHFKNGAWTIVQVIEELQRIQEQADTGLPLYNILLNVPTWVLCEYIKTNYVQQNNGLYIDFSTPKKARETRYAIGGKRVRALNEVARRVGGYNNVVTCEEWNIALKVVKADEDLCEYVGMVVESRTIHLNDKWLAVHPSSPDKRYCALVKQPIMQPPHNAAARQFIQDTDGVQEDIRQTLCETFFLFKCGVIREN